MEITAAEATLLLREKLEESKEELMDFAYTVGEKCRMSDHTVRWHGMTYIPSAGELYKMLVGIIGALRWEEGDDLTEPRYTETGFFSIEATLDKEFYSPDDDGCEYQPYSVTIEVRAIMEDAIL